MLKHLIFVILISTAGFAQNPRLDNINAIYQNIGWLKQQLKTEKSAEKIEKLKKQLERTENTFSDLASETSLFSYSRKNREEEKPGILNQIEEILNPVISNLKRASSRPRKMERLRDRIGFIEERIKSVNAGLVNIEKLIKSKDAAHLLPGLTAVKDRLLKLKQENDLRKNLLEQQLQQMEKESGSVVSTVRTFIDDVFKTKGKNLLLALLTAVAIFVLMRMLKKVLFKRNFLSARLSFLKKTIATMYGLITGTLSVLGGVFCLYFLNDWFLFTLAILVIAGVLWSSKQLLPKMVKEIRLMLNLGSVRENERIVWNGCPWLVKKIGFRCTLENKELEGGHLKLSVDKIYDLYSRHVIKDEPWFPTKKNDWVILDDNTYGKVVTQTPEQVVLELIGRTRKYYPLPAFIGLNPQNLSTGFSVSSEIGIDYSKQKEILKIVDIFKKEFLLDEYKHGDVLIEFKDAAAHSLDIFVRIMFPGEMAEFYYKIQRLVQAKLVEICNNHDLDIPFEQLTVHMSK